ncbi:MAG: heme-binding protein [Proteobacteria bacterium]|nr:heme-binding protein [Pseudomonadota bacterium]
MSLTRENANRIADAAIARAEELGIGINVAVVDGGGRLIVFQRMDNAAWAGMYGSQGKAIASVAFGRSSAELQERAAHPTLIGIRAAEGEHMIFGQGAMPVFRDGKVIGACGVGGGTSQQDEDCAIAGIAALG